MRRVKMNLVVVSLLLFAAGVHAQGVPSSDASLDYRVDTCDVLQVAFSDPHVGNKIHWKAKRSAASTDLIAVQKDGSLKLPFALLQVRGKSVDEIQRMLDELYDAGKVPQGKPHVIIVDGREERLTERTQRTMR